VFDEHVPFFKRAFVEQQFQPLARGELALAVLGIDALSPPPSRAAARLRSSCSMMSCMNGSPGNRRSTGQFRRSSSRRAATDAATGRP
jgi:hypothetical protein